MSSNDCYEIGQSNCCGAAIYLGDICSECKDYCLPIDEEEETVFESQFGMKFNTKEVNNE